MKPPVWFFYDDEELFGISKTVSMIDLTGGDGNEPEKREMPRQERLAYFKTIACDNHLSHQDGARERRRRPAHRGCRARYGRRGAHRR